jgi:3-hydroxybutyryl-CoA dehydrogenase
MENITVVGAGTMGNGIAHVFAMNGYRVSLVDISEEALEKGMSTIARNLDRMIKKDKINEEDKQTTLGNIATFLEVGEGCRYSDLVVEAASESVEVKLEIFKELLRKLSWLPTLLPSPSPGLEQLPTVRQRSSACIL